MGTKVLSLLWKRLLWIESLLEPKAYLIGMAEVYVEKTVATSKATTIVAFAARLVLLNIFNQCKKYHIALNQVLPGFHSVSCSLPQKSLDKVELELNTYLVSASLVFQN